MVVKMRKWLPWPPNSSRKFQVFLTLHSLEGLHPSISSSGDCDSEGIMMDVKWKGPKGSFFRRRSLKRVRTSEKQVREDGIVRWDEETYHECIFTEAKNNSTSPFLPWDVHFVILKVIHQGGKTKLSVTGTAVMNISDYVAGCGYIPKTTKINVSGSAGAETDAVLVVTVNFMEPWNQSECGDLTHPRPSLPCISSEYIDAQPLDEFSSGRTMKNAKRPAEGKASQELYVLDRSKLSSRSEGSLLDPRTLFESSSDSIDEYDDEGLEDDGVNSSFRKSFSYGTLAGVNLVLEGALPSFREGQADATDQLASIHTRIMTDIMPKVSENTSDSDQAVVQQTMRSLLSWKKRKLSFRSPRARGEPLLNKSYGDDGGDDIDHDRRQSCASPNEQALTTVCKDENLSSSSSNISGCLDFGDEKFSIGCWEKKEFVSRDGDTKLAANVFFASIDQRNEKAAGESACTALVAVIAEWLHRNPNRMPIRAEFDSLIREGSAQWRRLCEMDTYQSRFPDGHFDLDTVLEAQVRPLKVARERSFVGFFQPEGVEEDVCDFLKGAMMFDDIWDAIIEETAPKESCEPVVYIVSWNDHFFILKVDPDAYYIIDTLGERLHEGCDQAYIIRFDREATLSHVPKEKSKDECKHDEAGFSQSNTCSSSSTDSLLSRKSPSEGGEYRVEEQRERDGDKSDIDENACEGKEACKCFLKEFFAAVPLRELQVDIKKGLLGKLPLHQRLQIEFHFMSLDSP